MQTWFIVYFRLCCADKRAPIHPWHATDNACSSSTSWKASQVWRAFSLPPQGSVTVSFLLCSRLNKDVLQSCGPLSVVSCHMQNTTFEHTSHACHRNKKNVHWPPCRISFSFIQELECKKFSTSIFFTIYLKPRRWTYEGLWNVTG